MEQPINANILEKLTRTGFTEVSKTGAIPTGQVGMFGGMAISHPIIITSLGKIFLRLKDQIFSLIRCFLFQS